MASDSNSLTANAQRREVHVGGADAGARLDRMLAAALPELSRSRLQTLIAQGAVTRHAKTGEDGATIRDPNHRVKPDDTYCVSLPPPVPAEPEPQAMPLAVVYEDSDLIVIDKPAGLVVHPAAGNPDRTLVNALLAHCTDLAGLGGVIRPGIVHRLDKDTSGLLVAAKTDRAMRGLAKQFAAHKVERIYQAVVWGIPLKVQGVIEGNIGRSPFDRKRMAVLRKAGKPACTRYVVKEKFSAPGGATAPNRAAAPNKPFAALIECTLETGRTHQIRVHLAHIGHPLIGDKTYGRARIAAKARTPEEETAASLAQNFPRQALHAGVLGFVHPVRKEPMRFESPWPEDLAALASALRAIGGVA